MKFVKKLLLWCLLWMTILPNFMAINSVSAQENNAYDYVLDSTVGWAWDNLTVDGPWVEKWADAVNNWIVSMIGYLINIFIVVGIAVAFIWGYRIMASSKEDSYKEWIMMIVLWIAWIIIMVAAKRIANVLVWDWWVMVTDLENEGLKWLSFANNLYTKLIFPLIKVVLYLVVWVLFFIMAWKVITFIISTDDAAKKKAGWIILWTVIGILIIMWSKQIVESVMWNQADIFNNEASEIQEIWSDTLQFWSIPIVAQIINWVMWLAMFAVLILIIIQTYRMLFKPDDSKNAERIKKTLLYVVIWVLVIGASYIISNVLIIK